MGVMLSPYEEPRGGQWACVAPGIDCSEPGSIEEELEACCSERDRPTIRERAWSSPIWYAPTASGR